MLKKRTRNRLKPAGNYRQTYLMIAIGAALMVVADLFFMGGFERLQPAEPAPEVIQSYTPVEQMDPQQLRQLGQRFNGRQAMIKPDLTPSLKPQEDPALTEFFKQEGEMAAADDKAWAQFAAKFEPAAGQADDPKIIIIIDDMGLSHKYSPQVIALPGPITLAFLPYAPNLAGQTQKSRDQGHELLIHTPMEPMNKSADPGPLALYADMSADEIKVNMTKIFDSFEGYVGINNHMGSRFTSTPDKMEIVVDMLKQRGLIFVDSKTVSSSVAADLAKEHGLYYAQRDVFLDHDPSLEAVQKALAEVEEKARTNGYAIAIGHPKENTIAALKEWIPTLADKGLVLAPLSTVVKHEAAQKDLKMVENQHLY